MIYIYIDYERYDRCVAQFQWFWHPVDICHAFSRRAQVQRCFKFSARYRPSGAHTPLSNGCLKPESWMKVTKNRWDTTWWMTGGWIDHGHEKWKSKGFYPSWILGLLVLGSVPGYKSVMVCLCVCALLRGWFDDKMHFLCTQQCLFTASCSHVQYLNMHNYTISYHTSLI